MPIAYLAVLLGAIVLGLASLKAGGGPRSQGDEVGKAQPNARPAAPPKVAAPPEATPEPDADPILRTPDGLRRKVLVKDLGVVAWSAPVGGSRAGPPLDYFSIHYLLSEPPAGSNRLQVATGDGRPIGWVPRDAVLEWDTRLMARPTDPEGRPPLVVYRDAQCLVAALEGRKCPDHGGTCPIEGEESGKPAGDDGPALGFPILASRSIARPDGSPATLFEVASLVRDRAPIVPPEAPPADLVPMLKQVDIAFVIDTTASMQAAIEAVRKMAQELVEDAGRRHDDVTLRLALIEFRDASPEFGFNARRVADFTDPASFRRALDLISAAERGDGSVDEAVLDGLALALPPPAGGGQLRWPTGRAGELATKMIVLLGDSPDHADDPASVEEIAGVARQSKITIATVAIDRPGYLKGAELTRYRAQWSTLAEESYRPPDPSGGFARPIEPVRATLGDGGAGEIVGRLQALIDSRVRQAVEIAALAQAEAEGRLSEYTDRRGLTMDRVAPVLADLHRGEDRPRRRPDPRLEGRVAPSVRRGWIAERLDGKPMVQLEVLMSRDELAGTIRELTQLQQAVHGNSRDLTDLLRIGTAAAAGEATFLGQDRGDETFAAHLRRRRGLPPARPDSLLGRTQSDLLQADDLFRAALVSRLRSSIAELMRRLNAPLWDDPTRLTAEGMAPIPYAPLDF
jgi:hypothetical protein